MVTLAFDTTLDVCSLAFLDMRAKSVIAARHVEMRRGHAEALHPLIGEAMEEASLAFSDLDRIAVTIGPGTFTGSRIGVAAARGFALALNVPIVGMSTLQAIAANVGPSNDLPVLAVQDARRGEVYSAIYGPALDILSPPAVVTLENLGALAPKTPFVAIGSAASHALEQSPRAMLHHGEHLPRASIWGFFAAAVLPSEQLPAPLYLRPADAKPPRPDASVRRVLAP